MEKNQDNQQSLARNRAIAHELEQPEVLYASEYQEPPLLFEASDPLHSREEKKKETDQQVETKSAPTKDAANTPAQTKSSSDTGAGADLASTVIAPKIEEEKEEETKDSISVDLIFADDTPELPNDDGQGEEGGAGNSGGDGADDNPVQQKNDKNSKISDGSSHDSIPHEVMAKMESTMHADFSNVNIKTNSKAAKDAGALAFTQGENIEFAAGQFNPNSQQGQELLGHELAHVVQQRQGRVQPTTSVNGMPVNDDSELEAEADKLGAKAAKNDKIINSAQPIEQSAVSSQTVQKKDPPKSKKDPFPVNEVEVPLPMDNDQKVKVTLNPMLGGQFSYTAAKFPEGKGPNLMNKPSDGGWSKKMQPITVPYGPGGIIATAEIGASLEAGLKGSFGIGEALIIPFVKPGRKATVSGSANLSAKVEGEVGLGVYGGLSIAHIAAKAYLNVSGEIGGKVGISGTALWNPEGDLISGTITLDTNLFAKAEASGGVKLTYYTPIADGTFAKFEVTKAELGIIEFPISAGVDLVTGKPYGSCVPKMEHISFKFPSPSKTEVITREEFEQRMGGVSQGGTGAPPYSYDEHINSGDVFPANGSGGTGGSYPSAPPAGVDNTNNKAGEGGSGAANAGNSGGSNGAGGSTQLKSNFKSGISSGTKQMESKEAKVDKTQVKITPKSSDYIVSGSYKKIYKIFNGKADAGKIAPDFGSIRTTGYSKDDKKCNIYVEVILTKVLPEWKEFPSIVKKSKDKSNKYQAYYKKVVYHWNKFLASIDKHESRHYKIDKDHFNLLPAYLKGTAESKVGSKVTEYAEDVGSHHDDFHKSKDSVIYKLPYLQKEVEKVKSHSTTDQKSGEYESTNAGMARIAQSTSQHKSIAQFPKGGSESAIRDRILNLAQGEIGKVKSKIDDGSGNKTGYERLLEYFDTAAPGVWPEEVIKSIKYQGPSFGPGNSDKDGSPSSGDQGGAKFPHWCGIFAIWATKKAGKDVGNWEPGRGVLDQGKLGTTTSPKPGDIGYINKPKQHHSIIKEVNGDTIISIDGNSGVGEVKEVTRTRKAYSGFFTAFGGDAIQKKEKVEAKQSEQSKIMPGDVMQKMEESFGTSFSDVTIHENSSKAKEAGALAYAQGTDLHFAPGQLKPNTQGGQELIGHELAHVVQQKEGRVKPTSQQNGMDVNDDPALEKEADVKGKQAAQGKTSVNRSLQQSTGKSVQQFENQDPVAPQTFIFDPYKYKDNLITRDVILKFLDTFVNDRGESLIIQFSMAASGYAQIGWLPAYIEVGFSTSFAYEKMQDFTYLLSANFDLSGKFGVGKASKKGGGAIGIAANAGYSYQWEYGSSKAVAGSIYNHLVNIYLKLKEDENLTEEQKQKLLIPLKDTDYVEAGAKKEIEVTTLGAGGFAQGEAKLGEKKGLAGSVEAMWSSSKVTHKDKQDGDKKDRTSLESSFSVNGNVDLEMPWLGGLLFSVPASFSTTSVVGDPNVNMNGKYQDFVVQPTVLVEAKKIQELLDTWSTQSGPMLSKACKLASKMPGFGDLNTSVLASAIQIVVETIPMAGGQIKKYLPDKFFENKKSKLKIAPKVAFKWRQQESSGKRSYELLKWSLALELGKVYGAENSEDGKADMEASVSGSTTLRLSGGIGTNTLYFIRQTYIDAPANKENKKPEWDSFKNSNKDEIATAIYHVVYNNGAGPSRNSSAGNTAEWQNLFGRIKSSSDDKKQFCIENAASLIKDLEKCFDKDDEDVKSAEIEVRDFVDLLSRIKSEFITSSKTLDKVIIALKVQYKKGGHAGVKSFLELSTSYGIDPVGVIQILGPYWGESAKSWFDRWGIPYKSYQQRATEPKMAQYERMANILQVRMVGNDSVLGALVQDATFGYEGEINDGNDGAGIAEIFQYAQNDFDFKEELKLDSIRTILKQNNFNYEFHPVLVLIYFLEKKFNFKNFLKTWEKTTDWDMAINRMNVIRIIGEAGYDFGIKVVGGEKENHKYFSYIGKYESMAAQARGILLKSYSWFTGYARADQMFFYNLIANARSDSFLFESLRKYAVSYPHTETNALRWLWLKITPGVKQDDLNYMIEHPPYTGTSNVVDLREAGIDYKKGFSAVTQKSTGEKTKEKSNGKSAIIPSGVNVFQNSSEATGLGALAFARGNDIHFAPGQFKPDTRKGQELIGHELHHVKQQAEGRVNPTTQQKGVAVNEDSSLEKEADEAGVKFADALQKKSKSESTSSRNINEMQPFSLNGLQKNNEAFQQKSNAPIQLKEDVVQKGEAGVHHGIEHEASEAGDLSDEQAVEEMYAGNWMRDYSQLNVPLVHNALGQIPTKLDESSDETIGAQGATDISTGLLRALAMLEFGPEITDQLITPQNIGVYKPEEHMDNPLGTRVEDHLVVDSTTGTHKPAEQTSPEQDGTGGWHAVQPEINDQLAGSAIPGLQMENPNLNVLSSSGLGSHIYNSVEWAKDKFRNAAESGPTPRGRMFLGTGLHVIEDYFAHSNFIEVSLNLAIQNSIDNEDESFLPPTFVRAIESSNSQGTYVDTLYDNSMNGRQGITTGSFGALDTKVSIAHTLLPALPYLGEVVNTKLDESIGLIKGGGDNSWAKLLEKLEETRSGLAFKELLLAFDKHVQAPCYGINLTHDSLNVPIIGEEISYPNGIETTKVYKNISGSYNHYADLYKNIKSVVDSIKEVRNSIDRLLVFPVIVNGLDLLISEINAKVKGYIDEFKKTVQGAILNVMFSLIEAITGLDIPAEKKKTIGDAVDWAHHQVEEMEHGTSLESRLSGSEIDKFREAREAEGRTPAEIQQEIENVFGLDEDGNPIEPLPPSHSEISKDHPPHGAMDSHDHRWKHEEHKRTFTFGGRTYTIEAHVPVPEEDHEHEATDGSLFYGLDRALAIEADRHIMAQMHDVWSSTGSSEADRINANPALDRNEVLTEAEHQQALEQERSAEGNRSFATGSDSEIEGMSQLLSLVDLFISHPADNSWWKAIVSNYVASNEQEVLNHIEARNKTRSNRTDNSSENNASESSSSESPIQQKPASTQLKDSLSRSQSKGAPAQIPDHVSVHENSAQASELGALAFTQGSDIHFAPGQFKPDTNEGKELIGHELQHVKQQAEGRVAPTIQQKGISINDDSKLEKEADDFGKVFANNLQADNNSTSQIASPYTLAQKKSNPIQAKKETKTDKGLLKEDKNFGTEAFKLSDKNTTKDAIDHQLVQKKPVQLAKTPSGKSDVIPEAENQFYAHGSFMGAGIELMADPKWNYILLKLMPSVHSDVTKALKKKKGSEEVIIMFENNPVTAAYGLARTQTKDAANENGRNDRIDKLKAFEWDAFLRPSTIKKFNAAKSPAEKDKIAVELVDGLLIAHGSTSQTIRENGPLGGLRQYNNVRQTRKSGQGGAASGAWMDLFGKAMLISSDPKWKAKADEIGAKARVENKKDQASDKTFVDKMSFTEVIELYKSIYNKELFSVILDVKSRDTNTEVMTALIHELNKRGVHVYGVGSFIKSELQGLGDVEQTIDGKKVASALQVLFFHKAGELQEACLSNSVAPGDTVMFNAGNLIDYDSLSRGKNKKKSYKIKDEVVTQLGIYKKHYGFNLGVYVQENAIDDRAATLITDLTNKEDEIFNLGFAWGGVTGETAEDIEPSLGSEKTGIGGQWIVGTEWDTDKDLPKSYTLDEAKAKIYEAGSGLGTDEEAIFEAIRNCTDRGGLKGDSAIMDELRDEMSGHDLWKALLLLEYGIEAMFPAVIQKIWTATKGWGTDENLIYESFQKLNATQIAMIRSIPGLRDILKDELSGDDLQASDDLLSGDYAKAIENHKKDVAGMQKILLEMSKGNEIERNTAEWLNPNRDGGAKNDLHVCTKTHDAKKRAKQHKGKDNYNAYFGANEIHPNPATYDAHIDSTRNIRFVQEGTGGHHLGKNIWMYDVRKNPHSTKTVMIHEVQHDADRHDKENGHDKPQGSPEESWNRYKTEFRAYWVDGRYNNISKEEDPKIKDFHNLRQKTIFDLLHGKTKKTSLYPWLWDAYDKDVKVNGTSFKSLVHNYAQPEGINLKNSPRIDDLYNALEKCKMSDSLKSANVKVAIEAADKLQYEEAYNVLFDIGSQRIRNLMKKHLNFQTYSKIESTIKSKIMGDFPIPDAGDGVIV